MFACDLIRSCASIFNIFAKIWESTSKTDLEVRFIVNFFSGYSFSEVCTTKKLRKKYENVSTRTYAYVLLVSVLPVRAQTNSTIDGSIHRSIDQYVRKLTLRTPSTFS